MCLAMPSKGSQSLVTRTMSRTGHSSLLGGPSESFQELVVNEVRIHIGGVDIARQDCFGVSM